MRKHGFGSLVVPFEAVASDRPAELPVDGGVTICVSYLEISGEPDHLRFLIARLRHRAPAARVVVGLWPVGDAILSDAGLRRRVGADEYVTSLREIMASCLDAAGAHDLDDRD